MIVQLEGNAVLVDGEQGMMNKKEPQKPTAFSAFVSAHSCVAVPVYEVQKFAKLVPDKVAGIEG